MKESPHICQLERVSADRPQGGAVLHKANPEMVVVTTRCDSCIAAPAQAARRAGVTEAELADAMGTAIALNAGAAYSYAMRTLEAYQQLAEPA